jgi:hypothetical protein
MPRRNKKAFPDGNSDRPPPVRRDVGASPSGGAARIMPGGSGRIVAKIGPIAPRSLENAGVGSTSFAAGGQSRKCLGIRAIPAFA